MAIKNAIIYSGGGGGTYSKVVRQLTSSGTWTKPTGLVFIEVVCIGGGGGGAGGAKDASTVRTRGGGGGNTGCMSWHTLLASELSSTEDYVIGSAGTGGVSQETNSSVNSVGSAGGDTFFSGTNLATSKVYAQGGLGALNNGNPGSPRIADNQKPITNIPAQAGGSGTWVAATAVTSQNTQNNFITIYGGGGGGGVSEFDAAAAGGSGSRYYNKSLTLSSLNGGAAATDGGDGVNYYMDRMPFITGTASTPYADVTVGYGTSGGGGGSSTSGNAGRGGDGGLHGGAGGGGGAARNDVGNSGRGGNGGAGVIILIEHIVA